MVNRLREADISLSDRLHGQENGLGNVLNDYYQGLLNCSHEDLLNAVDVYLKAVGSQLELACKLGKVWLERIGLDRDTLIAIMMDKSMVELLQDCNETKNFLFRVEGKTLSSKFFLNWNDLFFNFINVIPLGMQKDNFAEFSKHYFDGIKDYVSFIDIYVLFDRYVEKVKSCLEERKADSFLYDLYIDLREIYKKVPLFYHLLDGAIGKLESDLIKNKIQVCDPEIVYTRQIAEDAILSCLKSFSEDSYVDKVKMREAMEFLEADYRKEARDNFEAADMVKNFLLKRYPYVAMLGLLSAVSELDDYTNGVFVVCRNAFQIFHGWGRLN